MNPWTNTILVYTLVYALVCLLTYTVKVLCQTTGGSFYLLQIALYTSSCTQHHRVEWHTVVYRVWLAICQLCQDLLYIRFSLFLCIQIVANSCFDQEIYTHSGNLLWQFPQKIINYQISFPDIFSVYIQ